MKDNPSGIEIQHRDSPTMYFVGVTTGASAINRIFPAWCEILNLQDAHLSGIDLPLHADAIRYREIVAQIKFDPLSLGALVTTHKIDLYNAAKYMFDELDGYADLCGDISCISKRGGRLIGRSVDPICAGKALEHMIDPDYWRRTGGHVLCIGAGGSAVSIVYHLLTSFDREHQPSRILVVNRSKPRLDNLRRIVDSLPDASSVDCILNEDPKVNDELLAGLPEGSMVINATGMGKDRPGSPITDAGRFPPSGIAWELNYRGELGFLHQANRQRAEHNVRVYDGWKYFVYGWSVVIAEVFNIYIDSERFTRLDRTAGDLKK